MPYQGGCSQILISKEVDSSICDWPLTRDLTEDLMKILTERGFSCSATAQKESVRDVKETLCHMRFEYDTELKSTAQVDKKQTHALSDGTIITIAPNVSVARKYFSSQVSLAKKPVESTTLLPR